MKDCIFTGVGTAIITPFKGGMIDYNALGRQLDFQLQGGADAIIVCGTTGEASTMSYHERMRTIEYCVDHVAGRIPVIAGSGSNSTENAIALSRDAQRSGADGLLVVTPYYNKATQAGLVRHFTVMADAVDIPLILYSVPSRTGVAIAPETYLALSRHPNILGTKEASGNFTTIQRTRALCPSDFYIWSGNDDETVPICVLGGKGVISVASNLIPEKMHELTRHCQNGDYEAAGRLQVRLKAFFDMLFCEVNPIPVKTAMSLLGWDYGELRLPLCPPSEENLALIQKTLADYSLRKD
ncbi:MAG: 4-hydroxy-tetrahydrodipicolinate synthase [Oscillibacter sp.]|nr:4-hydroxy-tetrahydrodipicolinate synthase [Oscillibacter sp.]